MLAVLADAAIAVPVDFLIDGEFAVPDADSITLTLRNTAGTIITGYNAVAQDDVTITSAVYTIPGAANAITSPHEFEIRYLTLNFTSGSVPGAVLTPYRVVPFVPLQCLPQDVREVLGGLDPKELPDSAVDLFESYLVLKTNEDNFVTALTTAGLASTYANRAVVLTEAVRLLPGMPARILKKDELNNAANTRNSVDFEQLGADLRAALLAALLAMNTALDDSTDATFVPALVVSLPTDPVTGA